MVNYLGTISAQIGIPLWALGLVVVWAAIWKLLALWKSARKGSVAWFVVLALLNTAGILEILYLFVFSKMGKRAGSRRTRAKPRRAGRRR